MGPTVSCCLASKLGLNMHAKAHRSMLFSFKTMLANAFRILLQHFASCQNVQKNANGWLHKSRQWLRAARFVGHKTCLIVVPQTLVACLLACLTARTLACLLAALLA